MALHLPAALDHRRAPPPVDEAEVGTLADLVKQALPDPEVTVSWDVLARRLLATGRIYLAKEA